MVTAIGGRFGQRLDQNAFHPRKGKTAARRRRKETGLEGITRQSAALPKGRVTAKGTACWSALSRDEEKLYVTNADSLIVFDVSGNKLEQVQSADVADVPKPVLRDLILGPGGKFLYAIEQRRRRILVYSIAKDGRVVLSDELAIGVPGHTLGLAIA